MKIFLRNCNTKNFYAGEGQWTADSSRARSFMTLEDAGETMIRDRLGEGMEVVFSDTKPQCELALRIHAE